MTNFAEELSKLPACSEAIDWIADRDLQTVWAECERSDWMFWLLRRVQVRSKPLVQIACDCAERALVCVPKGEDGPRKAIERTRAWSRGKATLEDVREATSTAYITRAADTPTAYAADYAVCAARNAAYTARASDARFTAYVAAQAVVYAAAWAFGAAGASSERKAQSVIIRQHIAAEEIADLWTT